MKPAANTAQPFKDGDHVTVASLTAGQQPLYDPSRLADAMYWLSHGDAGRRLAQPRMLGLALSACLITELVVARAIEVSSDLRVWFRGDVRGRRTASDHLGPNEFEVVQGSDGEVLGRWLRSLQGCSVDLVERRLIQAGCTRRRGPFSGRYALNTPPGQNRLRISSVLIMQLHTLKEVHENDAFLITIGMKIGLKKELFTGASPAARRYIDNLQHQLGPLPELLVGQIETAIGDDALRPH